MFNPYYGCAVHEHVSGISKKNDNYLRPENHIEIKLRKEAKARLEKRLKEKNKRQKNMKKKQEVNSQDGILSQQEEDEKYNNGMKQPKISSQEARKQDAEVLLHRNCKVPHDFYNSWIKRIPGRTNRFFNRYPLDIDGKVMSIVSDKNYFAAHQFDSTGFRVWDMAVVLARYLVLDKEFRSNLVNKRCIEIGCGMGVVSLAIAMMGEGTKEIIATDGDLAAIENVNVNKHLLLDSKEIRDAFKTSKLLFANSDHINKIRNNHRFDLIFATDVFYMYSEELMRDIARTIIALAIDSDDEEDDDKDSTRIIAYIGYQERKCCEYETFLEFLKEISSHGLFYRHLSLPEPYHDVPNTKSYLIAIMKPAGLKLSFLK